MRVYRHEGLSSKVKVKGQGHVASVQLLYGRVNRAAAAAGVGVCTSYDCLGFSTFDRRHLTSPPRLTCTECVVTGRSHGKLGSFTVGRSCLQSQKIAQVFFLYGHGHTDRQTDRQTDKLTKFYPRHSNSVDTISRIQLSSKYVTVITKSTATTTTLDSCCYTTL